MGVAVYRGVDVSRSAVSLGVRAKTGNQRMELDLDSGCRSGVSSRACYRPVTDARVRKACRRRPVPICTSTRPRSGALRKCRSATPADVAESESADEVARTESAGLEALPQSGVDDPVSPLVVDRSPNATVPFQKLDRSLRLLAASCALRPRSKCRGGPERQPRRARTSLRRVGRLVGIEGKADRNISI